MTDERQEEFHNEADDKRELAPESVLLANSVSLSDSDSEAEVRDQADEAPPRQGTLAWLQLQEHIEWEGIEIPACHRVPAEAERATDRPGLCAVVRGGERCRGIATRLYGLCLPHAGGGAADMKAVSLAGHAAKAKLRQQRVLLGVGPNRVGSARQRARVAAALRADEIATALVDDVLDADLAPLARQQAVLRILDAVEPLQTMSVEVEVPTDQAGVQALGWVEMQALASQLLGDEVSSGVHQLPQSVEQSQI
jgi:hypothetical protein